jgi:heat shock protein HtpX
MIVAACGAVLLAGFFAGGGERTDGMESAIGLAMGIVPIAAVISIIFLLIGYFSGHKFVLSSAKAVELTKQNAPEMIEMVERLSQKAGLPMPKVYAINDKSLNAFATGRNPKNSYIAITKGLADKLETDELEGVIAHELSHIKHYDIRLMLITIACISFATIIAELLLRSAIFSRRDRNNGLRILLFVLAAVFYVYGYLLAPLIRLAISRTREFQADAGAALITGSPQSLISALRKISGHSDVENLNDKETISPICIESPLKQDKRASTFSRVSGLFATHPPIEKRIKALEDISMGFRGSDIFR